MEKKIKHSYLGVNQDLSKSKHNKEFYYEGQHIKIVSTDTQSTGSITNEKGNELVISLPSISINTSQSKIQYGTKSLSYKSGGELDQQITDGLLITSSSTQEIIGKTNIRNGIVLITSDKESGSIMNCIWLINNILDDSYNLELLYVRNLQITKNDPIQALFNYENENIQKIYWVDGTNQIRNINIKHSEIEGNSALIDLPSNSLNFVGNVLFSQPIINSISNGGTHTSGMIQYTYNLYNLNASQTKLAPLSKLVSLDKGNNLGGGELGEIVGAIPNVIISNIDPNYKFIKIYAIKYTSFNQIPSVSLISEREISGSSISIYDNGNIISSLSLEEFLFLGSDPVIPKHIESKDNRLFLANLKSKSFDVPDELDCRAYSFNATPTSVIYDNIYAQSSGYPTGNRLGVNTSTWNVPKNHDAVNLNYGLYKYQSNGSTLGGEGKFIKYEIVQKSLTNPDDTRVLKDREVYRIGIQFYNKLGQISLPKWIADYKMPTGNLQGNYNTLKVELKPAFYTWLNSFSFDTKDDIPVGYKIIRADRTSNDKTILAQGILSSMIFQIKGNEAKNYEQFASIPTRESYQDGKLKFPTYLIREFDKIAPGTPNNASATLQENSHLQWVNDNYANLDEGGEICTSRPRDGKISQTFEHTKIMQLYSPEILFDIDNVFQAGISLKTIGLCKSTANGVYAEERYIETKLEKYGGRTLGGINPWQVNPSLYIEDNNFRATFAVPQGGGGHSMPVNAIGFIGPTGDNQTMNFKQYYRSFNTFINDTYKKEYVIYGTPEICERGAEDKFYNNDTRYSYSNSLLSFTSDGNQAGGCEKCDPIFSMNSYNAKCLTLMLGNSSQSTKSRKGLETLHNESNLADKNGVLLTELIIPNNTIYLGGIYGGNSYEDKKRSNYIEIGSYNNITTNNIQIDDAGDTFVQKFKLLRINKTDTEIYNNNTTQFSEIVEYYTETTVDLKNRNDISLNAWDSRFQPRYDEYHKYNRVYSQQSNLIKNTDVDFNFKKISNFDTRIQTTKLKIPNESIDSWTDILVNETLDLDGKYGPINGLVNFNDKIFSLQDKGLAEIIINPRIQVQATSGIELELGRGTVLYDYEYRTNKSGSINKWSIISTKNAFYYYDALNKGIFRFPTQDRSSLSDMKGLHIFFNNNYDYDYLKIDNPLIKSGFVTGYDNFNNDIYFTALQGNNSFTRCFNELSDSFIDLKTYLPSLYINEGEKLLLANTGNNKLYEQYKGEYNKFFDQYQPSYIILQINPDVNYDCTFNNIKYNSELYLNDIDQPDKTLTHITAYNEYQNSGRVPLILGRSSNLRRKFREWNALIPREANSRNRLRNPWIFLKLELDNVSNYKLILHDIIIDYNVY